MDSGQLVNVEWVSTCDVGSWSLVLRYGEPRDPTLPRHNHLSPGQQQRKCQGATFHASKDFFAPHKDHLAPLFVRAALRGKKLRTATIHGASGSVAESPISYALRAHHVRDQFTHSLSLDESPYRRTGPLAGVTTISVEAAASDASRWASWSLRRIPCTLPLPPRLLLLSSGLPETVQFRPAGAVAARTKSRRPP